MEVEILSVKNRKLSQLVANFSSLKDLFQFNIFREKNPWTNWALYVFGWKKEA